MSVEKARPKVDAIIASGNFGIHDAEQLVGGPRSYVEMLLVGGRQSCIGYHVDEFEMAALKELQRQIAPGGPVRANGAAEALLNRVIGEGVFNPATSNLALFAAVVGAVTLFGVGAIPGYFAGKSLAECED